MIRVLVERRVKEGKREALLPLLRELRAEALHQGGYVTGETLSCEEDPSLVCTLSSWRSLEDWQAWEDSRRRFDLYRKIEPLLDGPAEIKIYRVLAAEV
jgi:heme-degrading monooxygenase HmoA